MANSNYQTDRCLTLSFTIFSWFIYVVYTSQLASFMTSKSISVEKFEDFAKSNVNNSRSGLILEVGTLPYTILKVNTHLLLHGIVYIQTDDIFPQNEEDKHLLKVLKKNKTIYVQSKQEAYDIMCSEKHMAMVEGYPYYVPIRRKKCNLYCLNRPFHSNWISSAVDPKLKYKSKIDYRC